MDFTCDKNLASYPLYLCDQRKGNVSFGSLWTLFEVKATSYSTILDIPMRPLPEDQRHRHRYTR